jgi:hypothetical protein
VFFFIFGNFDIAATKGTKFPTKGKVKVETPWGARVEIDLSLVGILPLRDRRIIGVSLSR